MLGANLFFKKSMPRTMEYTQHDRMRDAEIATIRNVVEKRIEHNNRATRDFVGHPRFGFQTMLNHDSFGKLPTAPAIVGGNTNWTSSKVTPITQVLHNKLSEVRPMNILPTIGSGLKLLEPSINSIHKQY